MTSLITSLNITSSPMLNTLIAAAAFVAIAVAADIFINKVLRKFSHFTNSGFDDRIIDLLHRPVFYTIILIGAIIVISDLRPGARVSLYANNSIYTLLIVLWGVTLIRTGNVIIVHLVSRVHDITGLSKDVVPLIENIVLFVIIATGTFAILSLWKVDVTPLLASAGIVGILVALAAKDTVGNFFGGVSIFIDKPFKIGDYVVLDGKDRGEVVTIGIRSTRIKTRDDILITIPNSIIANSKIINESAPNPNFRVRVPVGVAYGSDIALVEETLLAIAAGNRNVIGDPAPRVRFREFGDSALKFELLCWAKEPALRGLTVHELNCAIYRGFGEKGIRIPFPQQDVHIMDARKET